MPYRGLGFICLCVVSLAMLAAAPISVVAQSPDDQLPDSAAADAVVESQNASSDDDRPADDGLRLPSLDQMLRVAMERHPDIRAARAELSVAEANLDRTRLKVVKELTAFRDRWLATQASLRDATVKLGNTERLAAKGFVTELQVESEKLNIATLQLQGRELEAELPFLIGGAIGEDVTTDASRADVRQQAGAIAEQVLSLAVESYRGGIGDIERCIEWSTRLMRIQKEAAQSDTDRQAAAMKAHLQRLQAINGIATAKFQAAEGTMEDGLIAEFAILEAKMLLDETD